MNHKGTSRIETERLILRPFTADDAEAAFKNWMSDGEVTRFLTWPTHGNIEITRKVLTMWAEEYAREDNYQWAIELKEIGQPIGSIAVVEINERAEAVQVGYCIGKPWWHRGYTSEAFSAVIDFLFSEVGVNRVEAAHDPHNPNSGLVMKKCGLTYEGTLRQAGRNNCGICDICMYGILRDEWKHK